MGHQVRRLLVATAAVVATAPLGVAIAGPAHADTTTGDVTVTLTDSTSAPLQGAKVKLLPVANQPVPAIATTDAGGSATISQVQPGGYRVYIAAPGGLTQYVPQQTAATDATVFQVTAGGTTAVTDQLLPSGNVEVSVVDRVSGAPVTPACVRIGTSAQVCNHPDGRYLFAGVPVGSRAVTVFKTKTAWPNATTVTVPAGPSDVAVPLEPAAAIRTTVQAADDPSVHPAFCVQPVYPGAVSTGSPTYYCDVDPATGDLLIGPLQPAAAVQLFAAPTGYGAEVYGAQWVGASGGSGDQRQAVTMSTTVGTVTTAPPVRLDHAGDIIGTVKTADNSNTVVQVRPFGWQDGLREADALHSWLAPKASTGGVYQIKGLGPYAWPVSFVDLNGRYAEQWSGGAADRYDATPVQVQAGHFTVLDATLTTRGNMIGGAVRTASSAFWWVTARNATTGDVTGVVATNIDGRFQVSGLTTDPIVLTGGATLSQTCTLVNYATPARSWANSHVTLTLPRTTSCPAPVTMPPSLTSKPVLSYIPPAKQVEIIGNAGGGAAERQWNAQAGLLPWRYEGGADIAGTPAVLYNPRATTTEVYARSGSHIVYTYAIPGGEWSGWQYLAGDVIGDPAVLYNPRFGTTEVYARSSANHLVYRYYYNGWSDWIDLGGNLTGNPTLIYNPTYGTTEVYANSGGHVAYKYYYNGWSNWIDLGGNITGNPTVMYNPGYGTTEVYTNSGGHVAYKYYYNGWSGWNDLGGNVTGDPAAIYNPYNTQTDVYVNDNGSLLGKHWDPYRGRWSDWTDLTQ